MKDTGAGKREHVRVAQAAQTRVSAEAPTTSKSASTVAAFSADIDLKEGNLDIILGIPVTLSMEVGRTSISIKDLMQLSQGSVVELDRLAGEPLDILVNGTLIAQGEVVVVNDKYGIRLTEVVSASERLRQLK